MHIIPAIDLIDGKCVRLTQGDYAQKTVYDAPPLEVAKRLQGAGITRLHVVDLDGAKAGRIINYRTLETLARQTDLQIDFGGGLKSEQDLQIAFDCGARQVTGGTVAVRDRALFLAWLERYGADKIILGADVKAEKIAVAGWAETSDLWLMDFLTDFTAHGITTVICTDIAKDGLLEGASVELYARILSQFADLQLIASGGVANIADLERLRDLGCYGAIVGKALYEGRITLAELTRFLAT